MKGYKATDANMCCRGFQYEIGKTYKIKGELEFGKNGFHFCKKIIAIDGSYDLSTSRVFEVEAKGKVESDMVKSYTDEIEFTRELSKKEIIKLANETINDTTVCIRSALAESKLALPETLGVLSKDESWYVRCMVAVNPNTSTIVLRFLSNDSNSNVRAYVARNLNTSKKILEKLSKENDWNIRFNIATNIKTPKRVLKHLSHDDDWLIRCLIAANLNTDDIALKKMCQDEYLIVQTAAKNTLKIKEMNL